MLQHKIRGLYRRGDIYWFGKQVHGRRSLLSLGTRDYVEAVARASEILARPELQPARSFRAEIERFLRYKLESNRFSKASVESKRSSLRLFAESVNDVPPSSVSVQQCLAFYNATKRRVTPSTAESYG